MLIFYDCCAFSLSLLLCVSLSCSLSLSLYPDTKRDESDKFENGHAFIRDIIFRYLRRQLSRRAIESRNILYRANKFPPCFRESVFAPSSSERP